MKIAIVYQSHTGRTAGYARELAMYLWQKGISVSLCSTSDFDQEKLKECDGLMLGCWTSGWFIIHQHPNQIWVDFAQEKLQQKLPQHLLLFTTYKFHSGSMFRNMKRHLHLEGNETITTLKSRTGFLSSENKKTVDSYVNQILKL